MFRFFRFFIMSAFKNVERKLRVQRHSLIKDLDVVLAEAASSDGLIKETFLEKEMSWSLVGESL